MELVYIGKIVNTHGLKGEIRILSDFRYKATVFEKDNTVYINDTKYIINSYRIHKNFDMITLDGVCDIECAENLKGSLLYINRDDYKFDGYLDIDLIGLSAYDGNIYKGKITDILKTNKDDLLVIEGVKRHLVPNNDIFVKSIDLNSKAININYIKGLDNED